MTVEVMMDAVPESPKLSKGSKNPDQFVSKTSANTSVSGDLVVAEGAHVMILPEHEHEGQMANVLCRLDDQGDDPAMWKVALVAESEIIFEIPENQMQPCKPMEKPGKISSFITVADDEQDMSHKSPTQIKVIEILGQPWVETAVATIILFNFFLLCLDTDARAYYPDRGPGGPPAEWVTLGMDACYLIFVCEMLIRMYADGRDYFKNNWNTLDLIIIMTGLFEYVLAWIGMELGGIGIIRVVRLIRLLRLMRVMRLFSVLKELRRLLQMMGSCFKTLFWSFLLLVLVMTIWAIIAVETLNPLVQVVASKGAWSDCPRCTRAFASTFMANITFFQTVVAGDSWGFLAVPVIEEYPSSAIVFVGALLTLVFGVLNLIVAVIVDTFAENRDKDVGSRAADMDAEEMQEKRILSKIFDRIDEDASGSLSFSELREGAQKVAEFRHWLRVMDIDARDLKQLFLIVDEDGSGEIDPDEFIEAMYRMKNTESKTATKFVKHLVQKMDQATEEQGKLLHTMGAVMTKTSAETDELKQSLTETEEHLLQAEKEMRERLESQEAAINATVEVALAKASEVAMEAALQAAAQTAKQVMSAAAHSSKRLAGAAHSRLQRQTSAGSKQAAGDAWGRQISGQSEISKAEMNLQIAGLLGVTEESKSSKSRTPGPLLVNQPTKEPKLVLDLPAGSSPPAPPAPRAKDVGSPESAAKAASRVVSIG